MLPMKVNRHKREATGCANESPKIAAMAKELGFVFFCLDAASSALATKFVEAKIMDESGCWPTQSPGELQASLWRPSLAAGLATSSTKDL